MDVNPYLQLSQTEKNTTLIDAAKNGFKHIVELLIKAKSNLEAVDDQGSTPLISAARNDHGAIVKLLIEAHANPNHANQFGVTALICAACNDNTEMIQLLLKANANLDARTSYGLNGLAVALSYQHQNASCALLYVMSEKQIQTAITALPSIKENLDQCRVLISESRHAILEILRDEIIEKEGRSDIMYFPFEILAKQLALRFPIWSEDQIKDELDKALEKIEAWRKNKNNSFIPSFDNQRQHAEKRQRDQNDTNSLIQEKPKFKK